MRRKQDNLDNRLLAYSMMKQHERRGPGGPRLVSSENTFLTGHDNKDPVIQLRLLIIVDLRWQNL